MKRADDIRDQIVGLMDRTEVPLLSNLGDHDRIKKAIAAGFFYNTANLQKNGGYRTVKNPQTVHIHPSSGMAEVSHCVSLLHVDLLACQVTWCTRNGRGATFGTLDVLARQFSLLC